MSVTEESGGRLNAFAKEPKIEVISQESSNRNNFQLIIFSLVMLIMAIVGYVVFIS
ncbi:high light inducible protein [Prochlorococcus sp. MIT 1307]|uniref:high light inducible protein n=1 Tax=Prochlorococcus sp. MIT 1307 TaxID=3096219 RepID=UPI002A7495B8|nr:high light inducible protein [Prochlorococcus sp. MIT 1307]